MCRVMPAPAPRGQFVDAPGRDGRWRHKRSCRHRVLARAAPSMLLATAVHRHVLSAAARPIAMERTTRPVSLPPGRGTPRAGTAADDDPDVDIGVGDDI